MKLDVVLGLQWGDEGKGKIVDVLAGNYPVVARFQGGPNAGHSLHFDGKSFVLRSVPSGIFREEAMNIVGNGVVLDPITFKGECDNIAAKTGIPVNKRIVIAKKAHLILPTHRLLDAANEAAMGKGKIGKSTKSKFVSARMPTELSGRSNGESAFWYFTTKADKKYTDVCYTGDVYLIFGKETKGLPEELLKANRESCVRIPMLDEIRSLNLSNAAAIAVYEALRQNNFDGFKTEGDLFK